MTINVATLSYVFRHAGMSYVLGVSPCFVAAWMMSVEFLRPCIKETIKIEREKEAGLEWTDSIDEIYIRAVPHGDNRYKRDKNSVINTSSGSHRFQRFMSIN